MKCLYMLTRNKSIPPPKGSLKNPPPHSFKLNQTKINNSKMCWKRPLHHHLISVIVIFKYLDGLCGSHELVRWGHFTIKTNRKIHMKLYGVYWLDVTGSKLLVLGQCIGVPLQCFQISFRMSYSINLQRVKWCRRGFNMESCSLVALMSYGKDTSSWSSHTIIVFIMHLFHLKAFCCIT